MNLRQTLSLMYASQADAWIGVDFDGTLAYYHGDVTELGKPIPKMYDRVKAWEAQGQKWGIISARAQDPDQIRKIERWCKEYDLHPCKVTAAKDPSMTQIWDDKAVSVIPNTGEVQ